MTVAASTLSNNALSELHVKYFHGHSIDNSIPVGHAQSTNLELRNNNVIIVAIYTFIFVKSCTLLHDVVVKSWIST